jgi:hypothetical protein
MLQWPTGAVGVVLLGAAALFALAARSTSALATSVLDIQTLGFGFLAVLCGVAGGRQVWRAMRDARNRGTSI